MIAADTSSSSALSLATIEAPTKPVPTRTRAKTTKVPRVQVCRTDEEITPLSDRRFARRYELADKETGVTVAMHEGTRYCGSVDNGCDWCREHDESNHAELDPTRTTLSIHIDNTLPIPPGINEPDQAEFLLDVRVEQVDALILALVRVRDRARADGVLAPREGATGEGDLASILNRPTANAAKDLDAACSCEACEEMRKRAFLCLACGYDGVPVVPPCLCAERPAYKTTERHAGGDADCNTGHARWRECPVCGCSAEVLDRDEALESAFRGNDDPEHAVTIIRDLRAALASRGIL
jgi:hypothetical protein